MRARRPRGYTYLGVLIAVALAGVALVGTAQLWSTASRREKEAELLFIGDEFRRAIAMYYDSSPGAKQFPKSLEELLQDKRYPVVRRYLRRNYADPMTGRPDWGIVKGPGDTIMGVYSTSAREPLKRANFPPDYSAFERAERYSDWRFAYSTTRAVVPAAPVGLDLSGKPLALPAAANSAGQSAASGGGGAASPMAPAPAGAGPGTAPFGGR